MRIKKLIKQIIDSGNFKSITKLLSKTVRNNKGSKEIFFENKEDKPTLVFAVPPRNKDKAANRKFQIGDSTKLKSELENTKNKLEELSDKNELLSKNSEKYITEKSKAGKRRHKKTEIIKNQIIKPMFDNKELIKSTSIKQRADKIEKELIDIFDQEDEEELNSFAKKYNLDLNTLKSSGDYFLDEKGDTIYRWCLKFSK
ncbi:hypothetical protein N9C35_04330 [Flavobacteriaceae bacterium]|nr:hypothetical protein [Flavobacteriaceae bacterium]